MFVGDSAVAGNSLLQNFHLKSSRISLGASDEKTSMTEIKKRGHLWHFFRLKILMLDSTVVFSPLDKPIEVDMLLLSHNPRIRIRDIVLAIKPLIIVFDASNSIWKLESWKRECEELNLRFHSVTEQGAFILKQQ